MADTGRTPMAKLKGRLKWWWLRKVVLRAWSAQNWRKGYKFGWVQRFRCCDHTTPCHYGWCGEGDR